MMIEFASTKYISCYRYLAYDPSLPEAEGTGTS